MHRYYDLIGTVKVKLEKNSRFFSFMHATNFDKHFPGIGLRPAS